MYFSFLFLSSLRNVFCIYQFIIVVHQTTIAVLVQIQYNPYHIGVIAVTTSHPAELSLHHSTPLRLRCVVLRTVHTHQ